MDVRVRVSHGAPAVIGRARGVSANLGVMALNSGLVRARVRAEPGLVARGAGADAAEVRGGVRGVGDSVVSSSRDQRLSRR